MWNVSRTLNKLPDDLAIPLMGVCPNDFTPSTSGRNTCAVVSTSLFCRAGIQRLLGTANSIEAGIYCFFPKHAAVLLHNYLSVHKKSMFFFLFLWKTIQRRKQWTNAFKVLTRAMDAGEMAQWGKYSLNKQKD
jgi:hypothetical protein